MRSAEWISIAFFAVFLVAGVFAPLAARKRLKAIGIGGGGHCRGVVSAVYRGYPRR